ncbi:helix-turn-helix domain-containing protein [Nannocystaceae bacterium ST9]
MSNVDELPPLSRNVLGYRQHQRLSQQALADRCQISRATVANIERGHVPTLATINTLAKALGTTPAKLLDDPSVHTTTTRYLEGLRGTIKRVSARGRQLLARLARRLARFREPST